MRVNSIGRWYQASIDRPWSDRDRTLSDQMEQYWTNFAKTGDPNGAGLPDWPRYGASAEDVMELGDMTRPIPDTYGHGAGDKVLETFGDILRGNTRPTDVLGRYGGEEFVVLMPNTAREQAIISAERLRMILASTLIAPLAEPMTISIGAVEFVLGESGDAFLRRVDEALYQAKRSGRNRVVAA